jgi:Zn-dependent protease with chaperone function
MLNDNNYTKCPNCGKNIPYSKEYATWCDSCEWNLQPSKPPNPKNVFEKIDLLLGKRYSRKIFDDICSKSTFTPKFTVTMAAAYILALFVHSITLLAVFAGILIMSYGLPNKASIVMGLIPIFIAVYLLPKPNKKPKGIISREDYSELYGLVDDIANKIGAKKVNGLVIDDKFNAFYTKYGLFNKSVIGIGLPLFNILSDDERVFLLAHELAHGVNRDIRRSYVVYTAIDTLIDWYDIISPDCILDARLKLIGLLLIPLNILLLGLTKLIYLFILILNKLTWTYNQHAEYLADFKASEISNTDSAVSALGKLYFYSTYRIAVAHCALNKINNGLFDVVNEAIEKLPNHEIERIRRVELMENSRLDISHPATTYRVEFLKKNSIKDRSFNINDLSVRMNKINNELRSLKEEIEHRIIEDYIYNIS